jgi:hypothetical protein
MLSQNRSLLQDLMEKRDAFLAACSEWCSRQDATVSELKFAERVLVLPIKPGVEIVDLAIGKRWCFRGHEEQNEGDVKLKIKRMPVAQAEQGYRKHSASVWVLFGF